MLRALCCFLMLGTVAAAQDAYPRLHDVVGVGSDDVLNVRAGPGASFAIVSELAYDARAVEVVRVEGNWGLVNMPEVAGWTSLRFLAPRPEGGIDEVPRVICGGTEPFWALTVRQGQDAVVTTPMNFDPGEAFSIGLWRRAYNPLEKWILQGSDGTRDVSVMVAKTYCNDGMSDNEFGLDATVIVTGPEGYVLSGCCELSE